MLWTLSPADGFVIELQLVIGGEKCGISFTSSPFLGCMGIPEEERSPKQTSVLEQVRKGPVVVCIGSYPPGKEAHPPDIHELLESKYASNIAGMAAANADLPAGDKLKSPSFIIVDVGLVVPLAFDQVRQVVCARSILLLAACSRSMLLLALAHAPCSCSRLLFYGVLALR